MLPSRQPTHGRKLLQALSRSKEPLLSAAMFQAQSDVAPNSIHSLDSFISALARTGQELTIKGCEQHVTDAFNNEASWTELFRRIDKGELAQLSYLAPTRTDKWTTHPVLIAIAAKGQAVDAEAVAESRDPETSTTQQSRDIVDVGVVGEAAAEANHSTAASIKSPSTWSDIEPLHNFSPARKTITSACNVQDGSATESTEATSDYPSTNQFSTDALVARQKSAVELLDACISPKLVEESISHYAKHSIGRSDFLRINNMFNAAMSEDLSFLDENASDIWPFGDLSSRIREALATSPRPNKRKVNENELDDMPPRLPEPRSRIASRRRRMANLPKRTTSAETVSSAAPSPAARPSTLPDASNSTNTQSHGTSPPQSDASSAPLVNADHDNAPLPMTISTGTQTDASIQATDEGHQGDGGDGKELQVDIEMKEDDYFHMPGSFETAERPRKRLCTEDEREAAARFESSVPRVLLGCAMTMVGTMVAARLLAAAPAPAHVIAAGIDAFKTLANVGSQFYRHVTFATPPSVKTMDPAVWEKLGVVTRRDGTKLTAFVRHTTLRQIARRYHRV